MMTNAGSSIHVAPPGAGPVPARHLDTLNRALDILRSRMRDHGRCNDSFSNLAGGRTFKDMFDDSTIWINYDPNNNSFGWVIPGTYPNDIVVGEFAFKMGRWSVAATIVHEAAHLNGAPGGASHAAELRVRECKMMSPNGPYDPTITG